MRQDLSALDRDIQQALGRVLQEAFKHGIDCDILRGGYITIYGNPGTPDFA